MKKSLTFQYTFHQMAYWATAAGRCYHGCGRNGSLFPDGREKGDVNFLPDAQVSGSFLC